MAKRIVATMVCVLLFVGAVCAQSASKAVWDSKAKQYKIEPGAKIRVAVDSDTWGNSIVALWDKMHPEAKGMVIYQNLASANSADSITQLQGELADIVLVIDGEVSRNIQSLMQLEKNLASAVSKIAPSTFIKNGNPDTKKIAYFPVTYDGMAFSWNKTMMEALGMDTTDKNKDGLSDAFDTWEEIFAWSKANVGKKTYKGKPVNIVFPMSLGNQWAFYSSLTAGGWQAFAEGDPMKPGFEKKEFLDAMDFIKAAADARISIEQNGVLTPGASMGWRWDDYLNNELSPFSLVGTWMDVVAAEKTLGVDFKFSPMPTWEKNRLAPLVKSKGFVINGFTKYPSAATELLRILTSKEGYQAMIDNSSYMAAMQSKAPASVKPDYSKNQNMVEMANAFAYGHPEPGYALPNNPAMPAFQVYYNINIEQSYYGVWDGNRTGKEAQDEIVRSAKVWIDTNNK